MLSFLKKLFKTATMNKVEDDHSLVKDEVKLVLSPIIDMDRALSFDISLGFDVQVGEDNEPVVYLKINRLNFTSNNESAKTYINTMDDNMLKSTISMLCIGASEHILTTDQGFSKNPGLDSTPAIDKSQLN